jgi:hypothetical protein
MPFTIIENKLLNVKSTTIDYTSIYLWNESKSQVVADNKMSAKDKYLLILEGVNRLKAENRKVFPALSAHLTDNKGNAIIASPNLLHNNTTDGIDAAAFAKNQVFISLTFNKDEFFNPCTLKVVLKDTKSEHTLNITTELEIE